MLHTHLLFALKMNFIRFVLTNTVITSRYQVMANCVSQITNFLGNHALATGPKYDILYNHTYMKLFIVAQPLADMIQTKQLPHLL